MRPLVQTNRQRDRRHPALGNGDELHPRRKGRPGVYDADALVYDVNADRGEVERREAGYRGAVIPRLRRGDDRVVMGEVSYVLSVDVGAIEPQDNFLEKGFGNRTRWARGPGSGRQRAAVQGPRR